MQRSTGRTGPSPPCSARRRRRRYRRPRRRRPSLAGEHGRAAGRAPRSRRAGARDGGRVQRRRVALAAARGSQTVVWSVRTGSVCSCGRRRTRCKRLPSPPAVGRSLGETSPASPASGTCAPDKRSRFRGHEGTIAASPSVLMERRWLRRARTRRGDLGCPDGTSIAELRGHRGLVLGAAFAPDGRTVVTGSTDGMIRTWAVASDPVQAVLAAPTRKPCATSALLRRQASRDGE